MNYTDALSLPSRAAAEELQLAKLQRTLSEIYRRNPFYTNKFDEAGIKPGTIQSLDDLLRLPLNIILTSAN